MTAAPHGLPAFEPPHAGQAAVRRAQLVFSALLVAVALFGLLGGLTGRRLLDSAVLAQVPMAASTAVLFLALGVPLLLRAVPGKAGGQTPISTNGALPFPGQAALPLLVAGAAFANGLAALLGWETGLLDLPFRELNRLAGVRHVNMSPATAFCFVCSGLACLALFRRGAANATNPDGTANTGKSFRPFAAQAAGALATLVVLAGVVFLLGYVFGTPLLYHSGVVPMARSTALAFLLLGLALVCQAGPELFPLRLFAGPSPQASLMRAFVPLTVALSFAHSLFPGPGRGELGEGSALLAAVLAVATAVSVGTAVTLVACRVGGSLDRAVRLREAAEQALRQALEQKTVLLKELHHRVKNNMQIASSLSLLQSEYVADPRDRVLFEESQARIRSMALVHEDLYKSDDLAFVDMGSYVPRLVGQLLAGASPPVRTVFEVADVRLPITLSMPCGMLLNELVMNAMKHAFPGLAAPELCVALRREGAEVVMELADNGPGLPPDFTLNSGDSFGMVLVESLTRQLRGSIAMEPGAAGGTLVVVRFPFAEE